MINGKSIPVPDPPLLIPPAPAILLAILLPLRVRFQPIDQALCDCAICPRCYGRHLPLSRQHEPALSTVATRPQVPRSPLRSLHWRRSNSLRPRCVPAALNRAHRPRPGLSVLRARPPSLVPCCVDRYLCQSCRALLLPAGDWFVGLPE